MEKPPVSLWVTEIEIHSLTQRLKMSSQHITFTKIYVIALAIFCAMDFIWLGFIAKDFYRAQIGFLMNSEINWAAAVAFYLLFVVGLVLFVIAPALEKGSWMHSLVFGALFGLITYATYDLSNLATLKDWPILVTIVDLAWGATLAASVSTATYFIARKVID
jgi:uncharacterized membrane protein